MIEQRKKFEEELIEAGMEDCFSFVPAESYHLTICDIDPSAAYDCAKSGVTQNQVAERVEQVTEAFKEMGVPGKITSEVVGWGLTSTVTALVKFQDTEMLKKVLKLENIIKSHAGVSVREFAGHITYGYLTKEPKDWNKYLEILNKYENIPLGPAEFETIDLTYFDSMKRYIPILSKNLVTGVITYPQKMSKKMVLDGSLPGFLDKSL